MSSPSELQGVTEPGPYQGPLNCMVECVEGCAFQGKCQYIADADGQYPLDQAPPWINRYHRG